MCSAVPGAFCEWVLEIIKTSTDPNRPQRCHSNKRTVMAAVQATSSATGSCSQRAGRVLSRSPGQVGHHCP